MTKGLQMARRLKTSSSKASQAAKTTQATRNAAISRKTKASNAKDIASFVNQTKMNLELQMVALQAQLDLVREITSMKDPSEKIELLFSLITTNGQMTNLKQVSEAVQQASVLLPFGESIQTALAKTKVSDEQMDLPGFQSFVEGIVSSLENSSMDDFAEFVVYQVLFTGVASQVAAASSPKGDASNGMGATNAAGDLQKSILNDERMQALFVLFDKDADATVDFKEVAVGLYPLTKNMGEAAKNAAGLLLMVDKDDQRELTYEQFVKLMLAVSGAFGMTFDELADQLTLALANAADQDVDESFLKEIMVAEEAYAKAAEKRKEEDERKRTLDALSYSRTQKLFELWDANHDGTIDFHELLSGLRRYQKSAMGSKSLQDAERDALMIMGHDKDRNQALDPEEFAYAMSNYADAVGTSLHELIDFMCVVSQDTSAVSEYETRFEEAMTFQRSTPGNRFKPKMGTILDTPEGNGDEEEEEEDDW